MNTCKNCGKTLEDGEVICQSCGKTVENEVVTPPLPPPPPGSYLNNAQTSVQPPMTDYTQQNTGQNQYQQTGFSQSPPIPPPQVPQQTINPYSGYGLTPQPKKSNSGLIIGIIIIVVVLIGGLGIAGYFGYKSIKNSDLTKIIKNEDVAKNKDITKDDSKDINNDIQKDEINDQEEGEIGVSDKLSPGYLTVMVDLRPSKKKIGMSEVKIKLTKIKDADGKPISEKDIRTVPFTVQSSFDYIFFENKKDLKFTSPGTYRATLLDKKGNYLVSGEVEVTK